MAAQFDAAEALLKDIQAETSAVRTIAEDQRAKVEKATAEVNAAVQEMREGEGRTRDEMREIRQEVDTIQEMLPKVRLFDIVLLSSYLTHVSQMLEKNKEAQGQSLAELQQELKSLKTILLSRGPSMSGSSTPPPLPVFSGKPSIPAWQLAGTEGSGSTTHTAPTTGSETKNSDPTDHNFGGVSNGVAPA